MKKATTKTMKCNVCNKPFKKNDTLFQDYHPEKKVGFLHRDCSFVVDLLQTKAGGKLIDKACKYLDKGYELTLPVLM